MQVWPSGDIVREKLALLLEMFTPVCLLGCLAPGSSPPALFFCFPGPGPFAGGL
jgi:hypothetical protein